MRISVIVGVYRGVIQTVRAFENEEGAGSALVEVDKELCIERNGKGEHNSLNDAGVYEVEVESAL